jgi:hypothetical protein
MSHPRRSEVFNLQERWKYFFVQNIGTKYRHFPKCTVPLLIAKNKEIKGHIKGFPRPPGPVIF